MLCADFFSDGERFLRAVVSGHADFADKGRDIVCAYVSASVQLAANLLTESFSLPVAVDSDEEKAVVTIDAQRVGKDAGKTAHAVLSGLYRQLESVAWQYPKYIKVSRRKV